MDSRRSYSALNGVNAMLIYPVVLRAAVHHKLPSDVVVVTHIYERLLCEVAITIRTECLYFPMVTHMTDKLLKFLAGL